MKKPKFKTHYIPLSKIAPNPDQRPLNTRQVAMLAKDIERQGLQYPITVFPLEGDDQYSHQLATGGHRFAAYKQLNRETIPAYVTTAAKAKYIAAAENLLRSNLDYLQQAHDMAILARRVRKNSEKKGGSPCKGIKPLARELGASPRTVGRLLAVAGLEPKVQTLARDRGMANDATFLYRLTKLESRTDRTDAIKSRSKSAKSNPTTKAETKESRDNPETGSPNKLAWLVQFRNLEKSWEESKASQDFAVADDKMKIAFLRKIFKTSLIKRAADLNG